MGELRKGSASEQWLRGRDARRRRGLERSTPPPRINLERVSVPDMASVHDSKMEMPTIDQSPEKGDEKEKLVPKPDPLDKVFVTKPISYLGRWFRIVLQDEDGPCGFIAISNFLILKDRITLPHSRTVPAASLFDLVLTQVFENMQNEEYDVVKDALKQSVSGLNVDILCSSINGFLETPQYMLFKTLKIPLYHCWVLNLDLQDGMEIQDAVEDRSYDRLELDRAVYRLKESSGRKDMDRKYDLIDKFFADSIGQKREFGLFSLKKNVKDKELFAFFRNNHFSIMYKDNGTFFSLLTPAYGTTKKSWLMLDENDLDSGLPVEHIPTPMDQMLNAPMGDYGPKTAKDMQSQHHGVSMPFESHSSTGKELQHDSSSLSSISRVETSRSPAFFKTQFASFFTGKKYMELENKFLNFLKMYKENKESKNLYYEVTVKGMKDRESSEMDVFYEHIDSFNPQLARSVCMCYERIRNNLNNAARTFIQELNIPDFHCENPVVRIREMPPPDRWIPVKDFFGMEDNKPARAHTIRCGESSITVARATQVGRIIFTNVLIKLSRNHQKGKCFNGEYTLEHVLVNDKLEVDITAKYCDNPGRTAEQLDYVRLANDLLPEYRVGEVGKMPGHFGSLEQSLRSYISPFRYGADMVRKFNKFIEAHPALKPELTRLAVIDNINSAHQSLTRRVKRLLQSILNSEPLISDWREAFTEQAESRAAPIHEVVYNYHKGRQDAKDGKGSDQGTSDGKGSDQGTSDGKGSDQGTSDGNGSKTVDGSVETTGISGGDNEQPFAGDVEGGLIFLRHVRHHGTEGSKDDMGQQQLQG